MRKKPPPEGPKNRILNAAERLFAQKGFTAVSVREITAAARSNVSAVNYHFGNKETLYLEVFRSRWMPRALQVQESFRRSLASVDSPELADILRALALAFLDGPMSDGERNRHHQLMARELAQPSRAFELVADEVMRPFLMELMARIRPFVPPNTEEDRLMLNLASVIAMVLYFNFGRDIVTRIGGRAYNADFRRHLAEHIARFSMGGMGMPPAEGPP